MMAHLRSRSSRDIGQFRHELRQHLDEPTVWCPRPASRTTRGIFFDAASLGFPHFAASCTWDLNGTRVAQRQQIASQALLRPA